MGDNLTLSCPFENYDVFKWYKYADELLNVPEVDVKIFNISTSHAGKSDVKKFNTPQKYSKLIQFKPKRHNETFMNFFFAGNFTCRAENQAGSNEYTYEIVVYSPPTRIIGAASELNHTIDIMVAANFSLDCPVQGIPAPKVCRSKQQSGDW